MYRRTSSIRGIPPSIMVSIGAVFSKSGPLLANRGQRSAISSTITTMSGNGAQRKSLASQIDRLDSILDGLADALNESIADAVKEVVGQVVREAVECTIKEVLASPELLRAALNKHAPAVTPAPAPQRQRLKGLLRCVRDACNKAKQVAGQAVKKLGQALAWGVSKRVKLTQRADNEVLLYWATKQEE